MFQERINFKGVSRNSGTLLLIISFIAISFRIYPFFKYKYLFGHDPYVHLSVIREMIKGNIRNNVYLLSVAPFGAKIDEPLGIYYIPLIIFKLISPLGISLYDTFRVVSVIFGVLTVVFFYLAVSNFFEKRNALFSSLFLSIMFAHIFRSMANYYRGDNYILFLFSVLLCILSIYFKKHNITKRVQGLLLLFFGILLGVSSIVWAGYFVLFIFIMGISMSTIFLIVVEDEQKVASKYLEILLFLIFSTAIGAIFVASPIVKEINPKYTSGFLVYFMYLFCLTVIFFGIAFLIRFVFKLDKRTRVLLFILALIIIGTSAISYWQNQFYFILTGFGYFNLQGLYTTIMELQKPNIVDLWVGFGISVFPVPFYFLHMKKNSMLFIHLGWIIPSIYLLFNAVRFIFLASLAIAFMAGTGLVEIENRVNSIKFISKKASMAIIISIFLITGYLSFTTLKNLHPVMDQNWERALLYLKSHSNEKDIVLAWWDYGGFIQYYAERPTLTDSVYGQVMAKYVAKYYLGLVPTQELKRRGVKYVIVNKELILKFDTIVRTANESDDGYFMVMIPLKYALGNTLVFSNHNVVFILKKNNGWLGTLQIGGKRIKISRLLVEGRDIEEVQFDKDGLILYANLNYGYAVVMNEKTFNTKFSQLMFQNEGILLYSDGGIIKIFRI